VDALSYDENPVEYLMNRFPLANKKPEVCQAKGRLELNENTD